MTKSIHRRLTAGVVALACWLTFCGCVYDSPITAKPTRKVEVALLGNWTSQDGKTKMKVGKYDEYNYALIYDGDLFRAWHSDVEGTPFFSVQKVSTGEADFEVKYFYMTWKLADDGTLHGRIVNDKVVPDETKGSDAVQKLLKANLKNPELLGDEIVFTKDK